MTQRMIHGPRFWIGSIRRWRDARELALSIYIDPSSSAQALKLLMELDAEDRRIRHVTRSVRVGDRYYRMMGQPGWPSAALDRFVTNEFLRMMPVRGMELGLQMLLIAITRKCPLDCAHCFEGEFLNQRDELDTDQVIGVIRKFQQRGLSQVQLSGGEPLNRFDDLVRIITSCAPGRTDMWILTSGWGLTAERAAQLKKAGLIGASVSVDHWDADKHDAFRRRKGSFQQARTAALNAREAGLVVALSLVPLREFCTMQDLIRYADMAAAWGAHFIRIVEPRAAGNFRDKDVELGPEEHAILEEFVRTLHRERRFRDHPIIDHYGAYQRVVGCSGAGRRYLYVDTHGDVLACPFCRERCGSALDLSVEDIQQGLYADHGCSAFRTV